LDQNTFYHDIIDSIFAALSARDSYTANHSIRVADLTQLLCSWLEVEPDEGEIFHMAAHLHDIGKIGISDSILNKLGRLLPEEWEAIKKHPQIGADIIGKSNSLKEISSIVLHHHERWDGLGYPDGLVSTHIPFGARIIAVCDSIDAMKSQRAYRAPLTDDICHDEIMKNIGKMYDPVIADCALKHWDELMCRYNEPISSKTMPHTEELECYLLPKNDIYS